MMVIDLPNKEETITCVMVEENIDEEYSILEEMTRSS